jgi:integrase-like protein
VCLLFRMRNTRHTFATKMLRAGVSFPVLMKLLGHTSPKMTMLYVEVARSKSRHLVPQPKTSITPFELGSTGLSNPCSPLNMRWRCSGGRCPSVLPAVVSTGSPIASSRSPPRRAKPTHPNNGQRLAGYVAHSETRQKEIRSLQGAGDLESTSWALRLIFGSHFSREDTTIPGGKAG